jgi:hypothetical protein
MPRMLTGAPPERSVDAVVRDRGLEGVVPPQVVVALGGVVLQVDPIEQDLIALDDVAEGADEDALIRVPVDGIPANLVALRIVEQGDAVGAIGDQVVGDDMRAGGSLQATHVHAALRRADDLVLQDVVALALELDPFGHGADLVADDAVVVAVDLEALIVRTGDGVAAQKVFGAIDLNGGILDGAQDMAVEEAIAVALDKCAAVGRAGGQVPNRVVAFAGDVDGQETAGDRAISGRAPRPSSRTPTLA